MPFESHDKFVFTGDVDPITILLIILLLPLSNIDFLICDRKNADECSS